MKVGDTVKVVKETYTADGQVIPANTLSGTVVKLTKSFIIVLFKDRCVKGMYPLKDLELINETK